MEGFRIDPKTFFGLVMPIQLGLCQFSQQNFWENRRLKAKSKMLEK